MEYQTFNYLPIAFRDIPVGDKFSCGAGWWIKRSTRTAHLAPESEGTYGRRIYWFGGSDCCRVHRSQK